MCILTYNGPNPIPQGLLLGTEESYVKAHILSSLNLLQTQSVNAFAGVVTQDADLLLAYAGDSFKVYTCVTSGTVVTSHTGSPIASFFYFL